MIFTYNVVAMINSIPQHPFWSVVQEGNTILDIAEKHNPDVVDIIIEKFNKMVRIASYNLLRQQKYHIVLTWDLATVLSHKFQNHILLTWDLSYPFVSYW